jgi:hypothetical protein
MVPSISHVIRIPKVKFLAVGDWRLAFRAKTPITTLRVQARRVASQLRPSTSVFRVYAEKELMSSTFIFDFLHTSVITSSTSDPPPL